MQNSKSQLFPKLKPFLYDDLRYYDFRDLDVNDIGRTWS